MFSTMFISLMFLMIAADIAIFALFIRKFEYHLALRLLWFIPALLLIGVYFYDPDGKFRDLFRIVLLSFAIPKTFFVVIALFDLPLKYFFKWKIYPFSVLALAVGVVLMYAVLYGGTVGYTKLKVRKIDFASPNLPEAFNGFKIVHVSDIHLRCWVNNKTVIEKMVEIINSLQPDVVVSTGDLVHRSASELEGFEDILASINARDGVFSVFGNHDYGSYRRMENDDAKNQNMKDMQQRKDSIGWRLLINEHIFLFRGNDSIALIGVENSGEPPFPDYADLPKAMKGTENTAFKILLTHDPTQWRREVLNTNIDLTLAGHTHAAQFMLAGFSPAAFVYSEWGGMYREGNQGLYINAGIGHVVIPFRFGAFPEITVIYLSKISENR